VGQNIFLFSRTHRLALGPTLPPVQWVLAVYTGVKLSGLEVKTLACSAELRISGAMPLFLLYTCMAWTGTVL